MVKFLPSIDSADSASLFADSLGIQLVSLPAAVHVRVVASRLSLTDPNPWENRMTRALSASA